MDVRFNANAAESLIRQMDKYCSGIQKETKALLDILNSAGDWNDNQKKAFQTNVIEIAKDLEKALVLESNYMNTFSQRVDEIRR